ncbi:uncharacterized protein N7484_004862 [Penicillium longicatenatum]|uniref:uncharacterized protein n=1 Tax=Penicillium longicatenatum TaxID=1561947 RepID=UPI0025485C8D|nr:uncharacterized protein N7484_004862 [Penicillium longicatenatum]KAJ5651139.1 hypothetical protein N7484_004862 [Penicillium longicatenatum]KAJ5671285.1 hypothetical protein N7507_000412 [Penicillium longicatenatum]
MWFGFLDLALVPRPGVTNSFQHLVHDRDWTVSYYKADSLAPLRTSFPNDETMFAVKNGQHTCQLLETLFGKKELGARVAELWGPHAW